MRPACTDQKPLGSAQSQWLSWGVTRNACMMQLQRVLPFTCRPLLAHKSVREAYHPCHRDLTSVQAANVHKWHAYMEDGSSSHACWWRGLTPHHLLGRLSWCCLAGPSMSSSLVPGHRAQQSSESGRKQPQGDGLRWHVHFQICLGAFPAVGAQCQGMMLWGQLVSLQGAALRHLGLTLQTPI